MTLDPAGYVTSPVPRNGFFRGGVAFDRLGYRRVEWKCDRLNERSRRAAIRREFTFEGIFRQHMIVKGRNRDTAWFALLDRDWPQAKEALRAAH